MFTIHERVCLPRLWVRLCGSWERLNDNTFTHMTVLPLCCTCVCLGVDVCALMCDLTPIAMHWSLVNELLLSKVQKIAWLTAPMAAHLSEIVSTKERKICVSSLIPYILLSAVQYHLNLLNVFLHSPFKHLAAQTHTAAVATTTWHARLSPSFWYFSVDSLSLSFVYKESPIFKFPP